MPSIATTQLKSTDQLQHRALRAFAKRLVKTVQLSVEKAVAYQTNAQTFPLSNEPNSLERKFIALLQAHRPEVKQRVTAAVLKWVNETPPARQNRLGDLASVNLRKAETVQTQIAALKPPTALKFTPQDIKDLEQFRPRVRAPRTERGRFGEVRVTASPAPPAADGLADPVGHTLQLKLLKTHCVDETNGWGGSEAGEDEMRLSGTFIQPNGAVHQISTINMGDHFDDGDWAVYAQPPLLATFDLNAGQGWPKGCVTTLVLAEADGAGDLQTYINALIDYAVKEVAKYLAAQIGAAIGATGGPATAVIGLAVGYAVGELSSWLKDELFGDDIFAPLTLAHEVLEPDSVVNAEQWCWWKGHGGHYEIWLQWGTTNWVAPPPSIGKFNGIWTPNNGSQYVSWGQPIEMIIQDYGDMWGQDMRLIDLQARVVNGKSRFSGVWNLGNHGQGVVWDWPLADFQTEYGNMWKENMRLICQQAYVINGQARFCGVWNPGDHGQFASWAKSITEIRQQYGEMWNQNMRLIDLQAYVHNGQVLYNAIWNPASHGQSVVFGWALKDFQAHFGKMWNENFRLVCQQAFIVNGQPLYLGVWNPSTENQLAVWNWDVAALGSEYGDAWDKGLRLLDLDIL